MKIRKIRLFLIILWFILAGLIVWLKVLPFGHATYSRQYPDQFSVLGAKGFIGRFSPVERLSTSTSNVIIGDPVYFSIFTPRTFNEVKLTIKYRNALNDKTPIIEAGVLVDNVVWRYKMAPLQNNIIDNNFKDWNRLSGDGISILQKNKVFNNISEVLEAAKNGFKDYCLDPSQCIAWYNADNISSNIKPVISKEFTPFQKIDIPLQGAHQFYFISSTAANNDFSFQFSDLNLNRDTDNVEISIYSGAEKLYSHVIKDESLEEESGKVRDFGFRFSTGLTEESALYKLEIKANNDIVIKSIEEAPSALNAISRLHPVSSSKPLSFWTDSSFLQLTAVTPAALQKIRFGNQEFNLDEAYQQFEFSNPTAGLKEVRLDKDDVIIENNGIFSFTPSSFFNPNLQQIDRHFVLDNDIKFVIAGYEKPRDLGNGWREASVVLNTKEAYREKGKYGFIISVPGLSLAKAGTLEIKEIRAEFSGRTVFDKILELFKKNENK